MTLTAPRSPTQHSTHTGQRVERLLSVDGMIVRDIPSSPVSGGGTRLAPDITEAEMRLLARAMTYKLATLELPVGGAKIGLRATASSRAEVIARFRTEIAPQLGSGALMTGPDLGTCEEDFAGLPTPGGAEGIAASTVDGMPVEEVLTGAGVASALGAALGGDLEGRTLALEGFGKMGASIAQAVVARGGRIVAVSTVAGCTIARPGTAFPLETLLGAREKWGDELIYHVGVRAHRAALYSVPCDALVPGARPGVLSEGCARRVAAPVIVPVANAPYTAAGLRMLKQRGIVAHADFVSSAGGAMAYLSPKVASARDVGEAIAAIDEIMGSIVEQTLEHRDGPYAGAVNRAERFLGAWLQASEMPDRPPLA